MSGIIKNMDGYFIDLESSTLKVGLYNGQETPRFISEELLPTAVSNSKIVDPAEFSREFSKMLAMNLGKELPKLPLYFILEPEITDLFLVTTKKNGVGDEEFINSQIKEKLVDENPDDLYYSYFKIAPFIHQFIGIKKTVLEPFLEAGNSLGLEVGGIFPLGLMLSKSNNDVSSMFIFPSGGSNTVVFSELTGVIFAEKVEGKMSLEELKDLFHKLSVYNNNKSDVNVYSYPRFSQVLGAKDIVLSGGGNLENGFESVNLSRSVVGTQPQVADSQINLINILPVPATVSSKRSPALIAAGAVSLFLIAGLIFQLTVGFDSILGSNKARGSGEEVLSQNVQTTPQSTTTPAPTPTTEPQKEVKRADIKIRVENGNGVAGSAGKLKAYLEGFGYNVVSVGNADKDTYEKTTVSLPKELSGYKDLLTNDIKTNYTLVVNEVDSKPSDYDVLIIAGLK